MPRSLSVLVLALVLLFAPHVQPAAARASADDGVHVDPDSAPAAEYALPLDAARRAAAGTSRDRDGGAAGAGADSAAPPPAFGSGITPKPAAAAGRGGSRAAEGATAPRAPGAPAGGEQATPMPDAGPTGSAHADGEPILYSFGGALAVLVAGGLLALTLRRRQSPA